MRIVQTFTILDAFKVAYPIAHVDLTGVEVDWVRNLVVWCTQQDIRYALDRHTTPLLDRVRYTPEQALDRIPTEYRRCVLSKGCHGWKAACLNLRRNKCELLVMPNGKGKESHDLTLLVNLWRDGKYVVAIETELPKPA